MSTRRLCTLTAVTSASVEVEIALIAAEVARVVLIVDALATEAVALTVVVVGQTSAIPVVTLPNI